MKHDAYVNPLCTRYAGVEMQQIFSDDRKYSCWRKLWLYLAEAEKQLGIPITDRQIEEMKIHLVDIDYERAAREEQATRHDAPLQPAARKPLRLSISVRHPAL